MKPIAIFYHTYISGPGVPLEHGISIFQEQIRDMEQSGLLDAASEFYIGVSGGESNTCAISMMAPSKAKIIEHGPETCAELPTLCALQNWLPGHEDWAILYFHQKGSLYFGNATWAAWRRCMMGVVVYGWKSCVRDLEQGFDAAGPHYLTPQAFPIIGNVPYFGGNFWWAKASFLATLPKLDPNGPSRYHAEVWIGTGKRKIAVRPYANHWPMTGCV